MARKRFSGDATAAAQVDSATPANPATGDIFTLRLENHAGQAASIAFTVAATQTVQAVVEGLKALAVAAKAAAIVPWNAVTVTEDDTLCLVTADVPGTPFWLTATATQGGGADDQTHTRAAVTACAGPSIFSDPNNWGGTIYADGDDVVIPAECPAIIYGQTYTATKPDLLTIENGYAYAIGTKAHPLNLTQQGQANRKAWIGGTEQQFLAINYCAQCEVRQAADMDSEGAYGLNLAGSNGTALIIRPDTDSRAIKVGELGSTCEWATLAVYAGKVFGDKGVVKNGAAEIDSLTVRGGTVLWEGNAAAIDHPDGTGDLTYRGADANTVAAYGGGAVHWDTDADITTSLKNGGGCLMDFDAAAGAVTVAAALLYRQYNILDRRRRVACTTGVDLVGCGRADGNIDRGLDYTEAFSEF